MFDFPALARLDFHVDHRPRRGHLPWLKLTTAYLILRPFFRPQTSSSGLDDWVVDLESAAFLGSQMGKTQELGDTTHPHLQLSRTMVLVPRVEPGNLLCVSPYFCITCRLRATVHIGHCDLIHAVEGLHRGQSDSSVLYILAVPLTVRK